MKKFEFDAVVIGTGAAGYNAAIRIKEMSDKKVCIITEGIKCGTSRNTGSDKQTYYKLGLAGGSEDSVLKMAQNLFSCGSMDGDTALCEAALSARSFLNLCELGVPFPVNRYGEYIGYKTDHDPYARATSAGPLTSKFMTEALEEKAKNLEIEIIDKTLAVEILTDKCGVCGLLGINTDNGEFIQISCADIVLATGGPAGIYADSVYPKCHTGTTSLALLSGAKLQNMTEWQYGLASVNPRWNVSGTYMQVLPRFVSVDKNGKEHEFLLDFFGNEYEALSNVFLKGYQWPFDCKKVLSGSSVIDLLVFYEIKAKGRRVYLDYRKNPFGIEKIDYEKLSDEAYEYLNRANALFGTPIERLEKMNMPAIELYLGKGVDLRKEMLEISLCAQHNNGGIAVDMWWQTNVSGLFAAGECAGTHGVTRPGGSALNSGQVGSLRAAQFISQNGRELKQNNWKNSIFRNEEFCSAMLSNPDNIDEAIQTAQQRMSEFGGAIRVKKDMQGLLSEIQNELANFSNFFGVNGSKNLYKAYKLRDILLIQSATLCSMINYCDEIGVTRGSALYYDEDGMLREKLCEEFRFSCDDSVAAYDMVQTVYYDNGKFSAEWRTVRQMPNDDDFFENVWQKYRENKNIF